jgi:hypothetical protein
LFKNYKKYYFNVANFYVFYIIDYNKEMDYMENEYAFQDAQKSTNNGKIVDEPIQSTMKGQQNGGGMLYLMYFVLYCIFFSMFFPS